MKSHSLSVRTEDQPQAYRRLHYVTQGMITLRWGVGPAWRDRKAGSEGHGLFLTASGWAGAQAARGGAGRPPGCRAASSESLCCDLTGPADTPGLGPGRLGLRNVAQRVDTLHFVLSTHGSPGSQEAELP